MAKITPLDILRSKKISINEFNFDNLSIPPINHYLSQHDIDNLRNIATSVRLSSRIQEKYRMVDDIMRSRGFRRFSAGTNRVVYKYMEDDRFLVKIAIDRVGMKDNPAEYINQFLLKPYVTKMFYTSQCGTVGFVERVLPIKNKEEFRIIASDVFDMLIMKILGKYVVEDIGTKYFMNYGIRVGFGPVLLDYPYVFKLDGNKLFCNIKLDDGSICNGEIDYNSGFNHLVCTKCGKFYLARDLKEESAHKIIISGGTRMKVEIVKGDTTIYQSKFSSRDVIERDPPPNEDLGYAGSNRLVAYINVNGEDILDKNAHGNKSEQSTTTVEIGRRDDGKKSTSKGKVDRKSDTTFPNPNLKLEDISNIDDCTSDTESKTNNSDTSDTESKTNSSDTSDSSTKVEQTTANTTRKSKATGKNNGGKKKPGTTVIVTPT